MRRFVSKEIGGGKRGDGSSGRATRVGTGAGTIRATRKCRQGRDELDVEEDVDGVGGKGLDWDGSRP